LLLLRELQLSRRRSPNPLLRMVKVLRQQETLIRTNDYKGPRHLKGRLIQNDGNVKDQKSHMSEKQNKGLQSFTTCPLSYSSRSFIALSSSATHQQPRTTEIWELD
jgi:hypothetical protein